MRHGFLGGIVLVGLVATLSGAPVWAQAPLAFQHLTAAEGLAHDNVSAVLQDRQGFLWFGTLDGLSRYDGTRVVTYHHVPGDSTSLLHDRIRSLHEDRAGHLWVGTVDGVSRFDPRTGRFRQYPYAPAIGVGDAFALALQEDRSGALWVATPVDGLLRLDPATGRYTVVLARPDHPPGPAGPDYGAFLSLFEDATGVLWAGTSNGLLRVDPRTRAVQRYTMPAQGAVVESNIVMCMAAADRGRLWLSTTSGLHRFDPATGQFEHFGGHARQGNSEAVVLAIAVDPQGVLWLGTNNGLERFDPAKGSASPRTRYLPETGVQANVERSYVFALWLDRTGVLWMGTKQGGASWVDLAARRVAVVTRWPDGRPTKRMKVFLEDRAGFLWMGGEAGLTRLDRTTGAVEHVGAAEGLTAANINVLYEDQAGNLWVGTEGHGLFWKRPGQGRFEPATWGPRGLLVVYAICEDARGGLWVGGQLDMWRRDVVTGQWASFPPRNVMTMECLVDRRGTFWVGTFSGFDRFDPDTHTFTHFRFNPADSTTLSRGWVQHLSEGRDGQLWVVTEGLNRFDPRTGRATRFGLPRVRLPGRLLYSAVEDNAGQVWLNTNAGIARFDPATGTSRLYNAGVSTMPTDESFHTAYRARDGALYFGTQTGYASFHPAQLRDNPYAPRVVLTGLQVDDQAVVPGRGASLAEALPYARTVTLAYNTPRVTFSFAALHFSDPAQNRYTYRLEDFDERWHSVTPKTEATYTQLPPGRYTFRVRAASSDGVWGRDEATVQVIVTPPWWGTWWFRTLAAAALLVGLVAAYRRRVQALAARNRALEHQVSRRTAEIERQRAQLEQQATKLVELDAAKSRFFSNVSHEFRTPLTLIRGYLDDVRADRTAPVAALHEARLSGALDQTHRLGRFVDELLDLTRLQAHRFRLYVEPGDLGAFVRRVVGAFVSLAERRQVTLTVEVPPEPVPFAFDPDRMEQVLANLIGNALKFTPAGGHVHVCVACAAVPGGTEAILQVSDTGPGVPPEALPRLFDRFFQLDDGTTRAHGGLGLGLALVKELVELHGGRVVAESAPGQGTAFVVRLPLDPELTLPPDAPVFEAPTPAAPLALRPSRGAQLVGEVQATPSATVLVAEDHPDLRAFLEAHLASAYRVIAVADGRVAWEEVQRQPPDLVVTDVMMPEVDGLELLQRLKQDPRYRAIPVLLLTARADPEDRLGGLEAEADGYLAKPFSVAELKALVRNLLRLRRAVAQQSGRQVVAVAPDDMPFEDTDAAFIRKVQAAITDHLADPAFDVPALSAALFMSQRTLQRRLAELTGFPAGAYLRQVRLLHAKELLDRNAYKTLSEVAHAVGFGNVSHFAKRYTQLFGEGPGISTPAP